MNVIVTGASRGIGFETVLRMAESGPHRILALARSESRLRELEARFPAGGSQLSTLAFDIVQGDYGSLSEQIRQFLEGNVNVLVNNAGGMINKSFSLLSEADFESLWRSNFLGPLKMIRTVLPLMKAGSHILNIGSMGGFQGSVKFPGLAAYSASKAALHNLTECLAEELKTEDIRINCLALGSAQTEMLEQAFPGYRAPLTAGEMSAYIADFALTGHRFFNGKVLPVAVTVP